MNFPGANEATAEDADFLMSRENTASPYRSPCVRTGRAFGVNGLHTNEIADSQEAWMLVLVLPLNPDGILLGLIFLSVKCDI